MKNQIDQSCFTCQNKRVFFDITVDREDVLVFEKLNNRLATIENYSHPSRMPKNSTEEEKTAFFKSWTDARLEVSDALVEWWDSVKDKYNLKNLDIIKKYDSSVLHFDAEYEKFFYCETIYGEIIRGDMWIPKKEFAGESTDNHEEECCGMCHRQ